MRRCDQMLGRRARDANAHECAAGSAVAFENRRRKTVACGRSLASPPATSLAADQRCKPRATAPSRPCARRRAARSFTISRGTCGMRAAGVPLRGLNGKTCSMAQARIVDQLQRVLEHRVGFGGKARDQIGAERGIGPQRAHRRRRKRSCRRGDGGASCASGSCRRPTAPTDGNAASAALPPRWRASGRHRLRWNRWRKASAA